MRNNVIVLLATVGFALSGCYANTKERMESKGFDSSYSRGYEDGLSSGKSAAGGLGYSLQKDTHRFTGDDQYRQGWTDGYDAGKTQQRDWQKSIQPKK